MTEFELRQWADIVRPLLTDLLSAKDADEVERALDRALNLPEGTAEAALLEALSSRSEVWQLVLSHLPAMRFAWQEFQARQDYEAQREEWSGPTGRDEDQWTGPGVASEDGGETVYTVSIRDSAATLMETVANRVTPGRVFPRVEAPASVVVDTPFVVRVGVAATRDLTSSHTGAIKLPTDGPVDIEIVLAYDPISLSSAGDLSYVVAVANGKPPPLIELSFTALSDTGDEDEELASERRIGVHYLHEGRLVGVAWRTVIAVSDEEARKRADLPTQREHELLDLSPLLADRAPDLTLAVFRAQPDQQSGRYVWTAYPSADVVVPDVSRARDVGDPAGLANRIGSQVADLDDRPQHFSVLIGAGRKIGQSIPPSIQRVIHRVVGDQRRTQPASVLLLTEDPYVPWELAVLEDPDGNGARLSRFGGSSPFLGAHAAISRWPLTDVKPRRRLLGSVVIETRAVVTAEYANVAGCTQLESAEAEARAYIKRFHPAAVAVPPYFQDVRDCLCGPRPADALHVALHGRFEHDSPRTGLILLTRDSQGQIVSSLLTPDAVQGLRLMRPTFVFLNACQVGQADDLLGDYAGMAASFLAAGACGVVAALWNVEDVVAGRVAEQFYDLVSGPAAVSVAEAMRRIRADYIDDLTAGDRCSATRMAYQFFGHPNLMLTTA